MNEFYDLKAPFVTRKVKNYQLNGRRHTSHFERQFENPHDTHRRLSDGTIRDEGTVGWLLEFGYRKKGSFIVQKKDSIDSTTSQDSYEDDKSIGSLGIKIRTSIDGQHYITSVNSGSPAALAGLRREDKILKVNETDTKNLANHQLLKLFLTGTAIQNITVESDQL